MSKIFLHKEESFFLSTEYCVKTNCISKRTYLGKKNRRNRDKSEAGQKENQQLSIDHTEDTHLKNSISSVVPKKSY